MFDSKDFPAALDEELFEQWLVSGRESKIGYTHLLIVWDEIDAAYKPVYIEDREEIDKFEMYGQSTGQESLVAAYDLYSESKIK